MKIAIVTSLFGNRDVLKKPTVVFEDVDYHAFVDNIYNVEIWNQHIGYKFTNDLNYSSRRNAKIYKILPELFLPGYDYYFWVDATHDVVVHPKIIIDEILKNNNFGCFKHTTRNCAYDEAAEIVKLNYDHVTNVRSQILNYEKEQFPKNAGLWELSAFIRKNTQETTKFNLMWWEQICKYSSRDQISFPYCLWKTQINPITLPGFANGINSTTGKIGNNPIMPQTRHHIL